MSSEKLDKKEKKIPEEWRNSVDSMNELELKNVITAEAKRRDDNERNLADDPDVNSLKDQLDVATVGYKEIREDTAIKIRYAVKVLKSKTV